MRPCTQCCSARRRLDRDRANPLQAWNGEASALYRGRSLYQYGMLGATNGIPYLDARARSVSHAAIACRHRRILRSAALG